METKTFASATFKAEPEGRFTARLCVWNQPDRAGDILRQGAFVESVERSLKKGRVIPVIFNHRWDDVDQHVGEVHPRDVVEKSDGLFVSGHFYLNEPIALKTFKQLERGALSEWSMGFTIQRSKPLVRGGRDITEAHLIECGPCLKGMGETETVSVKAALQAKQELDQRRRQLTEVQLRPYRLRLELLARKARLDQLLAGSR